MHLQFRHNRITTVWEGSCLKMRLVILDTSSAVSEWAAKYVMKRINEFKPGPEKYFVLGLPTGKNHSSYIKFQCML